MSGFKSGALELRKKDSIANNADPANILLAVNTQNILYTVDEFGIYRYLLVSGYLPLSGGTLTGNLSGTNISISGNLVTNSFSPGIQTFAGSTLTMTSASPYNTVLNGATTLIVLPDATTLTSGISYNFFNNTVNSVVVSANGGSTLWTIAANTSVSVALYNNSIPAGSWVLEVNGSNYAQNVSIQFNDNLIFPTNAIGVLANNGSGNLTWIPFSSAGAGSGGSVSSVGLSSTTLTISNTPITTSGNILVNLSLFGTSGTYTKTQVDKYGRIVSGGFLTSSDIPILPYYPASASISWNNISGTPSTLSGYGITSSDTLFNSKYAQLSAIPSLSGLSLYLPLSGGTLTGPLTGTNISATNISGTHFGNLSGTSLQSLTANQLTTPQNFGIVGDIVASNISFNGTGSVILSSTLSAVGTSGIYTKVQTDSKGRVISGTTLTSADIPVLPYLSTIPSLNYGSVSSVGLSSTTLTIGLTPVTTSGNISVNLSPIGTSGVYTKISSDAYGRVISGTTLTSGDIPVLPYYPTSSSISWTKISGTPTTLSGYGITSSDNLFDKKYLMSGAYLPLSGGTLSGPGNLSVSGNEIVAGTIIASNFYTDANQNISISNPNNNGNNNILIGSQMGNSLTSAATFNVFIGPYAGSNNISGSGNVYVGSSNGQVNAGSNNTFLGFSVGYNQLSATNLLLIDTGGGRGSGGAELSNSLIVGTGHTFPSLQTLSLNANTTVSQNLNVSGTTTLGTLNGILKGTSGVVSIATSSDFPALPYLSAMPTLNYLPLSGGTLSGPGNLSVSGNEIVAGTIIASNFYTDSYNLVVGSLNSRLGVNNVIIGAQAGQSNTSAGGANTFIGQAAGQLNASGDSNVYIGNQTGQNNIGHGNVYIGRTAGSYQTSSNNQIIIDAGGSDLFRNSQTSAYMIVGQANLSPANQTLSLNANTTVSQKLNVSGTTTLGTLNGILKGTSGVVSIATSSDFPSFSGLYLPLSGGTLSGPGNLNVSGAFNVNNFLTYDNVNYNTNLGLSAGKNISTGKYNVLIGNNAGSSILTAQNSVYIGTNAGSNSNKGNNVYIGTNAGATDINGAYNTFLGYSAGYYQANPLQTLILDVMNRSSSADELASSLIVGKGNSNASLQTLSLNANTTVSQNLNVSGTTTLNILTTSAGGDLTGNLQTPTVLGLVGHPLSLAFNGYLFNNGSTVVSRSISASDVGNLSNLYLPLSGGTLTGVLQSTTYMAISGGVNSIGNSSNVIGGGPYVAAQNTTNQGWVAQLGTSNTWDFWNLTCAGTSTWTKNIQFFPGGNIVTPGNLNVSGTTTLGNVVSLPFNSTSTNSLGIGTTGNFGSNNFELGISISAAASHWPFGIVKNGSNIFTIDTFGNTTNYGNLNVSGSSNFVGDILSNTGLGKWRVFSTATDTVNNSPWYGLGYSNLNMGSGSRTQLAGYWGIRLQTAAAYLDIDNNGTSNTLGFTGTATLSGGLNVSGTMLGRQASQTANTNPYNLGNISPYWVFANTNSVVINLPSSPSVGCAFCVVNATAYGVTVNAGSAIISTIYNNFASSVAIASPASFSNGPYNWFVYDGTHWWFTGSFIANY